MTHQERDAAALLRCGASFVEAADSSGLSVPAVMALWRNLSAGDAISQASPVFPRPRPKGRG
jgi:hypothetical protein